MPPIWGQLLNELTGRGLVVGGVLTWAAACRRPHRERLSALRGDARDTVVVHHHLVEPGPPAEAGGPPTAGTLCIRTIGQG